MALGITHSKAGLTLKSVNKTLVCDHSNGSYWAALSRGVVYYVEKTLAVDHLCERYSVVLSIVTASEAA